MLTALEPRGRMRSCCSCSTSSTTGPSPRRSSSASGWRRSGISPTSRGCSPRRWASRLVAATVCYLVDLLAAFLVPDFAQQIHPLVVIVPAIAEIWMVFYLLVVGVRTVKPDKAILAAAAAAA